MSEANAPFDIPASAPEPRSIIWTKKLASIDTVSRNPNLGLIETVRDELRRAGVEAKLTTDASGGRANLFATVPAHDGSTQYVALEQLHACESFLSKVIRSLSVDTVPSSEL